MKKYYNVEFSYNIEVEAKNEEEAEEKAIEEFDDIDVRTDEMNINVTEKKEVK